MKLLLILIFAFSTFASAEERRTLKEWLQTVPGNGKKSKTIQENKGNEENVGMQDELEKKAILAFPDYIPDNFDNTKAFVTFFAKGRIFALRTKEEYLKVYKTFIPDLHRLDGPAIIFHDGTKIFWINGVCVQSVTPTHEVNPC